MTKFKKILMIGFEPGNLGIEDWKRIDKLSREKILLAKDSPEIIDNIVNADCLLVKLGATVDKDMIIKASNLKYIGMFGTGYGRIDTKYATDRGIAVCNIAGYSTEGVAELAFALILEYVRDVSRANIQAKVGNYSEDSFNKGIEILGKTFGIIGLGRIGSRIGEIAMNGFNAKVIYWSRTRKKKHEKNGIKYKDISILLKESDFISLNLAYVPETKIFLNSERINDIKPGAVVLNLSQNELVDLDALEKRLSKGDIIYILDHSDELTEDHAKILAKYKNCIMYPPIGYVTLEATKAKLKMFVDNLENYLKGKTTNRVN